MTDLLPRLALLALVLLYPASGCSDSSRHKPTVPWYEPGSVPGYVPDVAPATSTALATPLWRPTLGHGDDVDYAHPSWTLYPSQIDGRPVTAMRRVIEEVSTTACEPDSRVSPHLRGLPPGWTVVLVAGAVMRSNGPPLLGLTDVEQRVIWVAVDGGSPDIALQAGRPTLPALAHEARHAFVFEAALARGLTHDQAARESKAIDP